MSDFGFSSSSSSSSSSGMNGAQRAELMDQVKSQLLVATLQELLSGGSGDLIYILESLRTVYTMYASVLQGNWKMSEKCFKKCIYKPGTKLDNSEQKCISSCMDRYMDAWNIVSKTYQDRLRKEHSLAGNFN